MAQAQAVAALEALGYNLNEARAYTALVEAGPSTGYEVSQSANVPRSAVYSVLRRLVAQGAVRSVAGKPERFVATPPEQFLSVLRTRFDSMSSTFLEATAALSAIPNRVDAFSVVGYDRVLEEAIRLIASAKSTLVISGWPREFSALEKALGEAVRREVYCVLFSHAALSTDLAGVHFSYGLDEAALEDFWRHRLVVVADDERTLLGATEQRAEDCAVLSEAKPIAEIAASQVALDITLLAQRHGYDTAEVMSVVLGERVGRLDSLLAGNEPTLGGEPKKAKGRSKSKRRD